MLNKIVHHRMVLISFFATVLLIVTIAFALSAITSSEVFGQKPGYLPSCAMNISTRDVLLKAPLTQPADIEAISRRLREVNGAWLNAKGLEDGTMVEYVSTLIPAGKPENTEIRNIGCAYDRGVDWWIPSDLALNWDGSKSFYEGVDDTTYVLLWEYDGNSETEDWRSEMMNLCAPPRNLPAVCTSKIGILNRLSERWINSFSLESVFSKDTGLLLRERFVTKHTDGGNIIGWDVKFIYGDGGYPEKAVMRSIAPLADESKFGFAERAMQFDMIDGAWMMREMLTTYHSTLEGGEDVKSQSVMRNDRIKVIKPK